MDKSEHPNCWDQAAGGHVDEGQTYDQAAHKELAEEIGITDVELTVLGTFRSNNKEDDRIINQFERVYLARIPHDTALRPEVKEVNKLQWFTPEELKREITERSERCTPGLLYGLRTYFSHFTDGDIEEETNI